jgi:hypothetical protein
VLAPIYQTVKLVKSMTGEGAICALPGLATRRHFSGRLSITTL